MGFALSTAAAPTIGQFTCKIQQETTAPIVDVSPTRDACTDPTIAGVSHKKY